MGIFSKNREEWAIVDIACASSSVTVVPFFDSLGPHALSFIIDQTEVTTMCVEGNTIETFIKLKSENQCKSLKNLVSFDSFKEEQKTRA